MRFLARRFFQTIVIAACILLVGIVPAEAQGTFETQFGEEAEEMIGETEKHVSGKQLAEMLMASARVEAEGLEEAVEGRILIVFFGAEGKPLHAVGSDPVKLEMEPPFIELADVMPGDRVVEGFERTLGEIGFQIRDTNTFEPPPIIHLKKRDGEWEPPPIIHDEKRDGEWEPPPIMLESGEVNPEMVKVLWTEVREPGVGISFVPTMGRYRESDEAEVMVQPAMMHGVIGE